MANPEDIQQEQLIASRQQLAEQSAQAEVLGGVILELAASQAQQGEIETRQIKREKKLRMRSFIFGQIAAKWDRMTAKKAFIHATNLYEKDRVEQVSQAASGIATAENTHNIFGSISFIAEHMLSQVTDLGGTFKNVGISLNKSIDTLAESLTGNSLAKAEEAREQRNVLQKIADGVSGGGGPGLASAGGAGKDTKVGGKGAGVFSKIGKAIGGTVGGLISGIGAGFAKVGKNAGKVIKGAVAIAFVGASLIPAAKAFQMFSEVSWKGVGIGITVLAALVAGVIALGVVMSSGVGTVAILAGAAALGILGLTLIPVAKAFEMFGAALNEHVMPALRQFQPIINDFIDRLVTNFGSLTVIINDFIDGLIVNFGSLASIVGNFIERNINTMVAAFGAVGDSIGGLITTIVTEISRLGALDGDNLLQVAAGITALGISLGAFGAGGAVGSIISSISGAFGKLFGAESPIEQIQRLAGIGNRLKDTLEPMRLLPIYLKGIAEAIAMDNFADNLENAADAFDKLMSEMKKGLNGLDTDKLITVDKIINLQGTGAVDKVTNTADAKMSKIANTTGATMEAMQDDTLGAKAQSSAAKITSVVTDSSSKVNNSITKVSNVGQHFDRTNSLAMAQ